MGHPLPEHGAMAVALNVVLFLFAAAAAAYWLWCAYAYRRVRRDLPLLVRLNAPEPPRWPALSVVVPACNEADKIAPAARSLAAQDYPELEIILVDDRSSDGTGEVIDGLAAESPRVLAVHLTELPDGWLGKVNALREGLRRAGGQYVLFTDADVHFRPGTLRKAVAWAVDRRLDFLAAFPDLWPTGLLLDAVLSVALRQLIAFFRPWAMADPSSRAFMGVGAFNLVRREALDRTAGLAWLRLEVADDAGLALMMKRSGARCAIVSAFGNVELTWYRTLPEAARGAEKGFATAGCCRLWRMSASAAAMALLEGSPLLCLLLLLWAPPLPAGAAGAVVLAAWALALAMQCRWIPGKLAPSLLAPLAAGLAGLLFLRAGWVGWRRGGVKWRGTLYPCALLREHQRVKFP